MSYWENLSTDIQNKLKKIVSNKYKQIGWNWFDIKKIRGLDNREIQQYKFLNKKIFFLNSHEFLYGVKEIFIDEIYKIELPEKPLIIDCGAHIGLSVIYIKNTFPDARIIAFEPDKKNFELLTENITAFNFSDIEPRNEAVWKENAILSFSSSSDMGSKINETGDSNYSSQVQAIRLNDIIKTPVDFLKLDIEGAEYDVIKDIEDKLSLIKNIFIEYHGSFDENYKLNEILTLITKNNFSYYIKEAAPSFDNPFFRNKRNGGYDVQLNIFCFRK